VTSLNCISPKVKQRREGVKMRYKYKFVNGFHAVFDCEKYENVLLLTLKRFADEAVKRMNANNQRGGK